MQVPIFIRGKNEKRTLNNISDDLKNFEESGNLKEAKNYNNVIHETFFDLPITQVTVYLVCVRLEWSEGFLSIVSG